MDSINWGEHVEKNLQQDAWRTQQEQEQQARELARHNKEQRALTDMSLVSHDFLQKARAQGYPGAVRESRGVASFGASKWLTVSVPAGSVSYMSRHYWPAASGYTEHPDGAWIASNGDWVFQQTVQYSGNVDYTLYLTCSRIGDSLSVKNGTHGRIEVSEVTVPRFINVLAQIAIDNGIKL